MPRVLFILAELGDIWTLYILDPLVLALLVLLALVLLLVLAMLLVLVFIFLPDSLDELLLFYFIS